MKSNEDLVFFIIKTSKQTTANQLKDCLMALSRHHCSMLSCNSGKCYNRSPGLLSNYYDEILLLLRYLWNNRANTDKDSRCVFVQIEVARTKAKEAYPMHCSPTLFWLALVCWKWSGRVSGWLRRGRRGGLSEKIAGGARENWSEQEEGLLDLLINSL